MKFSYTKANSKSFLFQDTKVWIIFTILSMVILLGFKSLVDLQITLVSNDLKLYNSRKTSILKDIEDAKGSIKKLEKKVAVYKNIINNNKILKDSIKQLFQLVPTQITLTKLELTQNKLIMKGITPSKDIYKFLLEIPLRSIFESSQVDFYLTKNGQYKFTSISLIESNL